jgi:hypothetical protein
LEKKMQVKYIGNHVKTDSIPGVGLRWEPGQQREVTSTVAAHLLAYPDTWIKGEEESDKTIKESQKERSVEAGDKPEPIDFLEEDKRPEEPMPVVNFHDMDGKKLREYAERHWNEKFPKHWGEDVVRERVIKRHTKEHAEEG